MFPSISTLAEAYVFSPVHPQIDVLMLGIATGISAGSIVGKLRSNGLRRPLTFLPYVAVASAAMVTNFYVVLVADMSFRVLLKGDPILLAKIYAISTFSTALFASWDIPRARERPV